jgi:hypothetical protein
MPADLQIALRDDRERVAERFDLLVDLGQFAGEAFVFGGQPSRAGRCVRREENAERGDDKQRDARRRSNRDTARATADREGPRRAVLRRNDDDGPAL